MEKAECGLQAQGLKYIRQVVTEGGVLIDQLFFHDPDGHMIEICNCQLLPVEPLSCPRACALSCSLSPCCSPAASHSSPNIVLEVAKLSAGLGMSASRFGNLRGADTPFTQPPRQATHGSSWSLEHQSLVAPAFDGSVWKSGAVHDLKAVDFTRSFKGETAAMAAVEIGAVSEFRISQHGFASDQVSQGQDVKRKRDGSAPCA